MDDSPFTVSAPTAAPLQQSQAYTQLDNTAMATPTRAMATNNAFQHQSTTPAFSPPITRRSTGASSGLNDDALDPSSPFVTTVADNTSQASSNQENYSPSKDKRRSRIMTGSEMTPLRMLQRSNSEASSTASNQAVAQSMAADDMLQPPKSPRKSISPMRRFPVRINTTGGIEGGSSPRGGGGSAGGSGTNSRPNSIPPPVRERDEPPQEQHQHQLHHEDVPMTTHQTNEMDISLDEAIAQTPGVKHAIEIFEDALDTMDEDDDDEFHMARDNVTSEITNGLDAHHQHNDPHNPDPEAENNGEAGGGNNFDDDTVMSEFSEFSAIPSMTTFARLGGRTPAQAAQDNTKGSLLDFTDSLRFPGGRAASPPKTMMTSTTPMSDAKKNRQSITNLLEFEIPPMPTPRSVPSITARELESLKSQFMSEISSLRATLSGKEAEAASLKTALMDAEKRAGETGEQLREERSMREQYHEEKETWEKRGREMETVLRQVKDEIMATQREREALEARLEESEGRREAAEMMAQEAQSKMAAMRASKVGGNNNGGGDALNSTNGLRSPMASQREIELAVEKVARELHAAYKSKHESKVAALKKNYEARWDKKIREMETKIDTLNKENEELRTGRDATMTKVEHEAGERRDQAIRDSAQIRELHAEVVKLEAVLRTIQGDNHSLRQQLEGERVEKGELVTLAEELMQMQANQTTMMQDVEHTQPQQQQQQQQQQHHHHQQQQQQHYHQHEEQQQQEEYRQPTPVERTTPPKRSMQQRASAPVPARSQPMGLSRSSTTTTPRKTAISPSGYGPGPASSSSQAGAPASKPNFRHSVIGRPGAVGGGGSGSGLTSGLRAPSRIGGVSGGTSNGVPHPRAQSSIARPGSSLARPASSLARPGGLMSSIQQMGGGSGGGNGYYRGNAGGRGE
ncbi:hypothetical protein BD289DRAFT_438532 [Coniella lustricola]|uniref:Uncharacterized protein n=1 Tax=Coniella lustricola TaxID=2025994 RepID=A0A2T3A2T7_9PEZI|nr:hypothetical protein BD289DRAFT_438532 [Coniella lustricola]